MSKLFVQEKETIEEIDYLRGFAILAVIAIHTSANFTQIPNVNLLVIINVIIDVTSQFAVPLFIFVSGFVLSLKYNGIISQRTFYKKRAESIIPQYIIFSIVYILLNMKDSAINGYLKFPSITKIAYYFFTASSYYHMWFFALIIQFYIFYPYIIKVYENFRNNDRTHFLIFLAFITQETWLIIKNFVLGYLSSNIYFDSVTGFNKLISTLLTRIFLSHIFYFILGIYLCQNWEYVIDKLFKIKKWACVITIVFTGVIVALWINGIEKFGDYFSIPQYYFIAPELIASLNFPFIFSILIIISLSFSDSKNKCFKYSNIILLIGKYSFGIYLIHALYIYIVTVMIFPQFDVDFHSFAFYPLLFISTLILSYYSVHLITYLPYGKILIGVKKRN